MLALLLHGFMKSPFRHNGRGDNLHSTRMEVGTIKRAVMLLEMYSNLLSPSGWTDHQTYRVRCFNMPLDILCGLNKLSDNGFKRAHWLR